MFSFYVFFKRDVLYSGYFIRERGGGGGAVVWFIFKFWVIGHLFRLKMYGFFVRVGYRFLSVGILLCFYYDNKLVFATSCDVSAWYFYIAQII